MAVEREEVVASARRQPLGDAASHGGRPAAGGDEPDAELHEADVGLGQRLRPAAASTISAPPPRVRPRGATTTGTGAWRIAWVAPWKRRMTRSSSAHSPSSASSSMRARFAPALKSGAARADDQPVVALGRQRHGALDHGERVEPDDVQLAVQLEPENAVAELERGRCRVRRQLLSPSGSQVDGARPLPDRGRSAGNVAPGRAVVVDRVRQLDLGKEPRRIVAEGGDQLERPELPAEAPAHGRVDIGDAVGDLRPDAGRVAEVGRQRATQELARAVLGADQHPEPCGKVRLVARHRDGSGSDFPARPVLAGLQIEGEDLAPLPPEEAGAGLLAERAALHEAPHQRRDGERVALGVVGQVRVAVIRDGDRDVDPDEVQRAKGRALRPPDERAGELVDLVRPETQLLGQAERDHEAVHAEPVGDEGGRVAGDRRCPCRDGATRSRPARRPARGPSPAAGSARGGACSAAG